MVGCPFFLIADPPETPNEQNQNQTPSTQQDLQNKLEDLQNAFAGWSTAFRVVIFIFLIVMSIFIFKIFRITTANKSSIENLAKFNSSLKQDFLNMSNRIQTPTATFDADELYQRLAAENENNMHKILISIDNLQNEISSISQKSTDSSQKPESESTEEKLSQEVTTFRDYYNAGIKDKQEWTNFIERYRLSYKIGVVNTRERHLNPQKEIAPIFKTHTAGCFLALYIEAEMLYAVVPDYDLGVEHITYFPGAFGEVFECSDFDDRSNYRISELIQPAIFEPDDAKETWTLKEKGILDLYKA